MIVVLRLESLTHMKSEWGRASVSVNFNVIKNFATSSTLRSVNSVKSKNHIKMVNYNCYVTKLSLSIFRINIAQIEKEFLLNVPKDP